MICKNCGENNAPLKKVCVVCGKFLVGKCVNNVTGELGYRDSEGLFHTNAPNDKNQ